MKVKILFYVIIAGICLVSTDTVFGQAEADKSVSSEPNRIVLNFQDAPISEVLDYLSDAAGLIIVADQFIDGRISVISKQPLDINEAVALLNTLLKEKKFIAVRMDRVLKIVPIDQAKSAIIPVSSGSNPDKVAAGDDMITHVIPIRYANAVQLKESLGSLLPSYAVLSSNEASNSLILTDTRSNVKRMLQIVQALDTQYAAIADVKVFHLMYADARNTAALINEIFKQEDTSRSSSSAASTNPFARMMDFGRGGGDRGRSSQQEPTSGINIPIKAAADDRTNAVVVSGPADTLEVVAKVVKDLDSMTDEERSIFVYPLKNAQADNLKTVLNALFEQMQQINDQTTSGSTGRGGRGGQTTRGFLGTAGGNTSASASSSGSLSDAVYVDADMDTNSLLIMTSSKNYEKIRQIIDDLDKPVPQVLIKVLLAEITTSNDVDLGTEFSVLNMRNNGGQTETSTTFPPTPTEGGLMTQTIAGDLDLTIRALQKIGKLNVLSRPYILTSNNQTAKITVGQKVPFITDTRTTETGQTINTIQYEEIGIILEVTPNINPDGLVILDIKPEISTTTADTVPISETLNAVVFATRSSQSRVAVKDGQTIVIGGLMQDKDTKSVSKVPLIGDIPLIGELFKRTRTEKEKTELLIFLTPQVATKDLELQNISENERSQSKSLGDSGSDPLFKEHLEAMESTAKKRNQTD